MLLYPSGTSSTSFWVICRSAESSWGIAYNGAAPGSHHLKGLTQRSVPKLLQWRCCLPQLFDFRSNSLDSSDLILGSCVGGPLWDPRKYFAMFFFQDLGGSTGSCDCQCGASDKLRSLALLPVAPKRGASLSSFLCQSAGILGIETLKSVGPNTQISHFWDAKNLDFFAEWLCLCIFSIGSTGSLSWFGWLSSKAQSNFQETMLDLPSQEIQEWQSGTLKPRDGPNGRLFWTQTV